ncbi:MAG TPA: LuxR C-terminal-related transcriptional regulator, partial [Aquaticitalea sp.]|nr:LuxR C-terminal-related transcriptional regulator [Aquaticitalea sp.]
LVSQYSPYFQNYSLSEYNAGNQNWGISQGENGKIYAANNNGLLVFDGLKWNLHEIPNKTTIRSVLAHKDRIYIGSYEEFGYWKKNEKGTLIYKSLRHLIDKKGFLNEEFWQILSFEDRIIFRSFQNVYVYENDKITQIKPASTVLSCDVVNGILYVSTLKNGVFVLDDKTLKPFAFNEWMVDAKVVSINECKGKLMIFTSLKGCYVYDGERFHPWNSEINAIIKEDQLNTFSLLNNGKMVFGTIQNGVYITNDSGEVLFHVSKENGLMNNTILDQFVTDNDELWLGLDNGIASVNLNSAHTFYNDVSGKLGAVYDVILFKETIYIGSNTGLYYIDKKNNLQFIEDSQGQVWELKEIDGQLLCGHNNGTYLVENDQIKLLSSQTGGWTLKRVPEHPNLYLQGAYTGLVKFENNSGKWEIDHMGRPTIPIRFLAFEDAYTVWAAHAYKGLFKIEFDTNHESVVSVKDYGGKGLKSDYNVRVYKLKSDICFKTNDGWQKYEPLLDSIVPYEFLNDNFSKQANIISEDDSDILAIKNQDFIELKSFSDPNYKLSLLEKYFKKRLIVGYERISKIKDSLYALNLNDGFMLINSQRDSEIIPLDRPILESVEVNKSLIDLSKVSNFEVPFQNKNITISVSSPMSRNHAFEYSITNLDANHWYPLENERLELSNLGSGNYKVLFRTSSSSGNISPTTSMGFTVLPPWYRTWKGFLLFAFIALSASIITYAMHKRKVKKEQRVLKTQYELAQNEMLKEKTKENDRKIVELKNEALKNELKLKSKQLANTAMALIKKNEALLDLKNELQLNKNGFENPFAFKKLIKKVDHSIGHKDEWKVFEYNFNQVHEEFFNGLKAKFPQLTPKDLKICAYIKMNLTTKEIAPLLNISTRGVETQRYRLKRKLNLDSDKNISDYLINFK